MFNNVDREICDCSKIKKKWIFKKWKCKFLIFNPIPKLINPNIPIEKFRKAPTIFPRLVRFTTFFRNQRSEQREIKHNNLPLLNVSNLFYFKKEKSIILHKVSCFYDEKKSAEIYLSSYRMNKKRKNYISWLIDTFRLFSPLKMFRYVERKIEENLFETLKKQTRFRNIGKDIVPRIKCNTDNFGQNMLSKKISIIIKIPSIEKNNEMFTLSYRKTNKPLNKGGEKRKKNYRANLNQIFINGDSFLVEKKSNLIKRKSNSDQNKHLLFKIILLMKYSYQIEDKMNQSNVLSNLWDSNISLHDFFLYPSTMKSKMIFDFFLFRVSCINDKNFDACTFFLKSFPISFLYQKKLNKLKKSLHLKKETQHLVLVKENSDNYLIVDQDFFFGFTIEFDFKTKCNLSRVFGVLRLIKLPKKNNKIVHTKKRDQRETWINLLNKKDEVIQNVLKKNQKNLRTATISCFADPSELERENFFDEHVNFQKNEIVSNKRKFTMLLHPNLEILYKILWTKGIRYFLWKFPKCELWYVRKAKIFANNFADWYVLTTWLVRKIKKKNLFKKKKTPIIFDFKQAKKKKNQSKKILERKFKWFKKKIKLLKKQKKFIRDHRDLNYINKISIRGATEKLFKDYYSCEHVFLIQNKIKNLQNNENCVLSHDNNQRLINSPSVIEKKNPTPNFTNLGWSDFQEKATDMRVGFTVISIGKPYFVFLSFKFIAALTSHRLESVYFTTNHSCVENIRFFLRIFPLLQTDASGIETARNILSANVELSSRSYIKKNRIKKGSDFIQILKQKILFASLELPINQAYVELSVETSHDEKETFSLENMLFLLKNELVLNFRHIQNFIKLLNKDYLTKTN